MIIALAQVVSQPADGRTLAIGVSKYKKGDFRGAEIALVKALKNERKRSTQVRILKFLAISRYMQGKKDLARKNLKKALQIYPNLRVRKKELLDESMYDMYKELKAEVLAAQRPAKVLVKANTNRGFVYRRGKRVGVLGKPFRSKAGVLDIEIRAKGFERKSLRLNVYPKEENVYVVRLSKIDKNSKPKQPVLIIPEEKDLAVEESTRNFSSSPRPGIAPASSQSVLAPAPQAQGYSSQVAVPVPAPQDQIERAQPSGRRQVSSSSRHSKKINILTFFPFGVGQFQNGDNLLGAALGGGQIATLVAYALSVQEADDLYAEASETINRANQEGSLDPDLVREYRDNAQTLIKAEEDKQVVLLTGFGVLWVGGITQAILAASYSSSSSSVSNHSPSSPFALTNQIARETPLQWTILPGKKGFDLALHYRIRF
ncbi:tetratricopeptide repeat protein [Pseudobacteriovorax antillogorgiicola]|nr:tetratricopeptide repeat protein [Pseudobacteriovorax antillogorgiicola]